MDLGSSSAVYRTINAVVDGFNNTFLVLPGGNNLTIETVFTGKEAAGISVLVVAATISLVAVCGLLSILAISGYRTLTSPKEHFFVRTHIAAYFVSLLICDLAQAIGSMINARWAHDQSVSLDGLCTIQGAMKNGGNVGTALWTLVIAIHTWTLLFLRIRPSTPILYATLAGVWSLIICVILSGPGAIQTTTSGPYFGISGFWCWISPNYAVQRFCLEYLFMFFCAGVSFILYVCVWARMRGWLVVDGWRTKIMWRGVGEEWRERAGKGKDRVDEHMISVMKQMLWYPVVYVIIVLPIAICRILEWVGKDIPFEATIFCDTIFLLGGLINVILFSTTRRIIPARSVLPSFVLPRPRAVKSTATGRGDKFDEAIKKTLSLSIRQSSLSSTSSFEVGRREDEYDERKERMDEVSLDDNNSQSERENDEWDRRNGDRDGDRDRLSDRVSERSDSLRSEVSRADSLTPLTARFRAPGDWNQGGPGPVSPRRARMKDGDGM